VSMLYDFQNLVDNTITRNRNLLDILTKSQDSNARVNRMVAKVITHCGCIHPESHKQPSSPGNPYLLYGCCFDEQLSGCLCDRCRSRIEQSLGDHLFYLAALCNALGLTLSGALQKEQDQLTTLGRFHLK
jgi:hypothetical protein